jgi:hypothetical protein
LFYFILFYLTAAAAATAAMDQGNGASEKV